MHRRWFNERTDDEEWIAIVSEKRWRIITSDKDLEFRHHEAIAKAKGRIFILSDLERGEGYSGWTRMLSNCQSRVVHDAHFAPCPFVARISHDGNIYLVTQLLRRGRTRNVTNAVEANFRLYSP